MITKTFTELTAILAAADELTTEEQATLVRRIRIFDAKNLLPTLPGEGSKAGRLDLVGASKAALFACLIDHGFDAEMLYSLRSRMDEQHEPSAGSPETRFEKAIAAIERGKGIFLVIAFIKKRGGKPWLGFSFDGSDIVRLGRAARAMDLHADSEGISSKVRTVIDLNAVLSPVITAYAG